MTRIREYMLKAVREAKAKTSWANQNENYENSVTTFVNCVLGSREFCDDFAAFHGKISHFGMLNSLAQTLIKLAVPGVPDMYQGSELWEFNLVDPDNRRPVDYETRGNLLKEFKSLCDQGCDQLAAFAKKLAENMSDGRCKLYLIWKMLNLRKQRADLFQQGEYLPLQASGSRERHLFSFARRHGRQTLIIAVPRLCAELLGSDSLLPHGEGIWLDTRITVPDGERHFRSVLTGEKVVATDDGALLGKNLFQNSPVAALLSE